MIFPGNIQRLSVLAAILIATLSSCGFDDDLSYTPQTKAGYFLVPADSGRQVIQWTREGDILMGWQEQFDISSMGLTDMHAKDEFLYLGDATGKRILKIDLASGEVSDRYFTGSLTPSHFAVGEDYILVCDSAARKLGFMRLRNGHQEVLDVPLPPSQVVYHNLKFHIAMDGDWLAIWSEKAATEMVAYNLSHEIVEMQFDAFKGLHVVSSSGAQRYSTLIDNNSTLMLSQENPLPSMRERYTPWLRQQYEQEWLTNVTLRDGALDIAAFPDSCDAFEMDFFESRVFLFRNDSLRVRELKTGSLSEASPFPGLPIKAAFHVGHQDE